MVCTAVVEDAPTFVGRRQNATFIDHEGSHIGVQLNPEPRAGPQGYSGYRAIGDLRIIWGANVGSNVSMSPWGILAKRARMLLVFVRRLKIHEEEHPIGQSKVIQ